MNFTNAECVKAYQPLMWWWFIIYSWVGLIKNSSEHQLEGILPWFLVRFPLEQHTAKHTIQLWYTGTD